MAPDTPAVSVLLPVRDAADTLPECIASIRHQTFGDVEYVVVDDGSTDGSTALIEAWAGEDRRVRLLRQEPRGLVEALERARAEARAPLLARMDADDVAHPERLERQVGLLDARPDVVLCGCGVEYFPEEAVRGGALRYQRWINGLVEHDAMERDLFVECPVAHPTFVMRAAAVDAAGGYRDRGWPEDYDLLLRLWEAGGRFAKVPDVLLRWREGESRLHRVDPTYSAEAFRSCKVHFLERTLLRAGEEGDGAPERPEGEGGSAGAARVPEASRTGGGLRPLVVWGAGPTGKAFALTARDAGVTLRAFVDLDPRKIGQEIHGAPVIAPGDVDDHRGALCVAAVGQEGAREEIRKSLRGMGWTEMEDFVAVA